jgi:hypothetical protein
MRSMQWQFGKLGTTSAFAFRPRETKKPRETNMNEVQQYMELTSEDCSKYCALHLCQMAFPFAPLSLLIIKY